MVAGYISQTDGVVLGSDTHLHTLSELSTSSQRDEGVAYVCVFTIEVRDHTL